MNELELPTIIVPARMASSRFPGKLLADAGGQPLILRTAERIRQHAPEFQLFFAVDSEDFARVLKTAGFSFVMTSPDLPSGTDRIAQANETVGAESVINVQADEPLVHREHLLALTEGLKKKGADLATLAVAFKKREDFLDSNQVKVVRDASGFAIYFSRANIPYERESEGGMSGTALKHLGMYGYGQSFLRHFASSKQGKLERIEKLEQLRALEMGFRISVVEVGRDTVGVDVPEDLAKLNFSSSG
ncbi:3-deoxy-manno-octulosonate cytidylyltransferase [Opitutales bacterium]|nr:3-deoxy-manno-octulosonate cytidylyltransferase [Opitutales bacterium]